VHNLESQMIVVFRRTGQRRYAVEKRELFPDLEKDPAPGYDPFMLYDLIHLVVEVQLGLRRGIFGRLATGGAWTSGVRTGPGSKLARVCRKLAGSGPRKRPRIF
jgi:hypothetical protein